MIRWSYIVIVASALLLGLWIGSQINRGRGNQRKYGNGRIAD